MTREELVAYARRDWSAVEGAKLADWTERSRTQSPERALDVGSALRRHVCRSRPDWPSAADREADLASHVALSRRLRLVDLRSHR